MFKAKVILNNHFKRLILTKIEKKCLNNEKTFKNINNGHKLFFSKQKMSFFDNISDFFEDLGSRLRGENEERRREERALEATLENENATDDPGASSKNSE